MKAFRPALCTGLAVIALSGQAQVVIADKFFAGDRGVLFDTKADLDWARGPTELAGGDYQGFHLASADEISQLFADVGLGANSGVYETYDLSPPYTPRPGPYRQAFDTLWFDWSPGPKLSLAPGVTGETFAFAGGFSDGMPLLGSLTLTTPRFGSPPFTVISFSATATSIAATPPRGTGRALVRAHVDAIPEPETYVLMMAGFGAVVIGTRKKGRRG